MCCAVLISTLFIASSAFAATFIVDDQSSGSVGTGLCADPDSSNPHDCSFTDAIKNANNLVDADIINFDIPGALPWWNINLTSQVNISEPVTIDGYTQPWTSQPNTVPAPGLTNAVINITIDGSGLAKGEDCINIKTSDPDAVVVIKGLSIGNCPDYGIAMVGGNKTIQGNYIGINRGSTAATPNGLGGIYVEDAHDVLIGGPNAADRNVISGNTGDGIYFFNDGAGSVNGSDIEGNFIGLDARGTSDFGNGGYGVFIEGLGFPNSVSGNNIGNGPNDSGDGKRNYISGNAGSGIYIAGGHVTKAFGWNQIANNYIGTDVNGTNAIPNDSGGVYIIESDAVQVIDNLISGNTGYGVEILGNAADLVPSQNDAVYNNRIGTDASGTNPLGNTKSGVNLHYGATRCYVGNPDDPSGLGNIIAYNAGDGVTIVEEDSKLPTFDNRVQLNSIFGNTGLGIDIGDDGVTLNDLLDSDTGANSLQNFPLVQSVSYSGGNTTISGALTSVPLRDNYRIDFYANDAVDPSGFGEGQTYIGFTTIAVLDGSGYGAFTGTVPGDYSGKYITATATDKSLYTSEFSAPQNLTDLVVTKSSTSILKEGEPITFTVTVSNPAGPTDATLVQVRDVNGGAFTYQTSSASQGTFTHTTGVWDIGTLTVGSSATLSINAVVNSCNTISNTASVIRTGQYDTNPANNSATLTFAGIQCAATAGGGGGGSGTGGTTGMAAPEEGMAAPEEVGYCAYTLEPKDPAKITRYEFAKMMLEFNCHTFPTEIPAGEKSFSDFPRQTSEDAEINNMLLIMYYALDAGIISGYPDGTLRPNDPVIYAEASKIVFNTVDGSLNTYSPAMSLLPIKLNGSEWFMNYFIFMIDLMWNSDLDPASTISSEDALSIINFIIEKFPK